VINRTGLTYFTLGAEGGAGAVGADWGGAEGAGVEGADVAGAPMGAGSRTTDDDRSPPRMARLKEVTAKRIATLVVIPLLIVFKRPSGGGGAHAVVAE
jgi:hypothetical protein